MKTTLATAAVTISPLSRHVASYKQASLTGVTFEQIVATLGFKPNVSDDPCKVKHSWAFTIDGEEAAIWDWKGSHASNTWSVYNPRVLALFAK